MSSALPLGPLDNIFCYLKWTSRSGHCCSNYIWKFQKLFWICEILFRWCELSAKREGSADSKFRRGSWRKPLAVSWCEISFFCFPAVPDFSSYAEFSGGFLFVFFVTESRRISLKRCDKSVVAGCDNGTHFSMCAGSVLWVPSMTLFLNQSYKTPVVVCFFVFVFISEVILYLILPVWFVSNFILALNILLHCGQTQGNYIIFLFSL